MPKKVVAKKVVAKKVVAKKAVTPAKKSTLKKKKLVYADNNQSFWVSNGQVLNSLNALQEALASMEKEVFTHHVNKDKHDFADWVDSVLCDKTCASELRKTKAPNTARVVVVRHLKSYDV